MLDGLDNLLLVCSFWNTEMESNAEAAALARRYGHKLASWQHFDEPVFDFSSGDWYVLKEKEKRVIKSPLI